MCKDGEERAHLSLGKLVEVLQWFRLRVEPYFSQRNSDDKMFVTYVLKRGCNLRLLNEAVLRVLDLTPRSLLPRLARVLQPTWTSKRVSD